MFKYSFFSSARVLFSCLIVLLSFFSAITHAGSMVGWGYDHVGQATPPSGNDFTAIAAGVYFNLALKSDGSIIGWGNDAYGQATPPSGNDFTAIAAGGWHGLALKSDGSIVGWGNNYKWEDYYGQATPPSGNDFTAIAAGEYHSLALKVDGSIVAWGWDEYGIATPPSGNNFVAIAAGSNYSLALKTDGSIVGWGVNSNSQTMVPSGNDFTAIAAGGWHGLAMKSDGSIVGWGNNSHGEATPPSGNDFTAIAAGGTHSLGLKSDDSIVGWGNDNSGAASPPSGNDFTAIAAGLGTTWGHSLAIEIVVPSPQDPPEPEILTAADMPDINAPPNKDKLIVLIHGRQPHNSPKPDIADVWVTDMANNINSMIANGEIDPSWEVMIWDWIDKSHVNFYEIRINAESQGRWLASEISAKNHIHNWKHVHLIGHSAGFLVIHEAHKILLEARNKGSFSGDIHLTTLDAYDPYISHGLGLKDRYAKDLDLSRDWADNYYSLDRITGVYTYGPFLYAYNKDISSLDGGLNDHGFPHRWYRATVTGVYPNNDPLGNDNLFNGIRYGFPRSLEAGGWQTSLTIPVDDPLSPSRNKMKSDVKATVSPVESMTRNSSTGSVITSATTLSLSTGSPVWTHVLLDLPDNSNYISFTYQFADSNEGYLTAYFNENLILIGDQRFDANDVIASEKIYVGDFMQDDNWLTFRLDSIDGGQSDVSISDIEIGTITNQADITNDLIVNLQDYAVLAENWKVTDCNNLNDWCEEADIDRSGIVDINDLVVVAEHWLESVNSTIDITDGLVAYYKLDGASGPVVDETGNNDGIDNGVIRGQAGIANNCFDFDRKLVDCGDDSSLNTPQVSVSVWFKTGINNNYQILMGKLSNNIGVGWSIKLRNDGKIWFLVGDIQTSNEHVESTVTFSTDTWYHLVVTYNSDKLATIYLDNVERGSGTLTKTIDAPTVNLQLGNDESTVAEQYDGFMDEIRIYNRALSASEVRYLFLNP